VHRLEHGVERHARAVPAHALDIENMVRAVVDPVGGEYASVSAPMIGPLLLGNDDLDALTNRLCRRIAEDDLRCVPP
jgi:hypothetical protein